MDDNLSIRVADLLTGSYDCVDRIVFNAYFQFWQTPAGFRLWWRQLEGSLDDLYQTIQADMQILFQALGIALQPA
jgi:hypothetical protein